MTRSAAAPSPTRESDAAAGTTGPPRRVLVVSADMGGGHHATGRALQESAERNWPGSEVRWVDTLDAMGSWVGPLFRRIYVANVQTTPWLYEFFYSSVWRHRWFATASKGFVAAWAGRRLARTVERFDPDLIVSTYPLGSAGLAWLRRNRSLPVPVGAWVSDFAPHPFWLYRDLDTTFVMHRSARPVAELAEPGIRLEVTGPPVEARFHSGDSQRDRQRLGLASDRFVALVSCGSYGFGAVREAVDALLAAGDSVQVVAACGSNERLRVELSEIGLPTERLRPLGWTDEMPAWTRAADVVVTNAGGATALEALATSRPVVMYRPIAAHGAANAALMTVSGLAETCSRPQALTALVGAMAADQGFRSAAGQVIGGYLDEHDAHLDLPMLASRAPRERAERDAGREGGPRRVPPRPLKRIAPVRRAWPLRPPDSFFLHVQTRSISQQIGAVITVDPDAGAEPLTGDMLTERIRARLPVMVSLRRRLVPRGDWRRPGWVAEPSLDLGQHVHEVTVADEAGVRAEVDRFWSQPLPLQRPCWQLLLVRRQGTGTSTLCFKMHHAMGDGLSIVATLDRLMDSPDRPLKMPTESSGGLREVVRHAGRHTRRVARGMWELGFHAAAPRNPLNRPLMPNRRGVVTVPLPSRPVRVAARTHQVRVSELMLGVVADALCRAGVVGRPGEPDRLRTMLPVAMPTGGPRIAGNSTGAVSIDLPVGPMSVLERVHAVRRDLHRRIELGEPHAAAFVMRALGTFPAPVHGWMASRVYNSQFFNMIASYVPGPRTVRRIAGNRFRVIYPVGALAEGVPLGVGVMRYGDVTGVCVLYDESLREAVTGLADAIRESFAELLPDDAGRSE